ncbi:MAG: fibronectin type III domain-containing protein [Oscillospiraceae bacterium]|nr:fibronectin type III domain-containing protein [Oscillospiraceae bacterium]
MKIKKILRMTAILLITILTFTMSVFTTYAQTYKEIGGCLYFEFADDSYNAKAEIENYYNMTCVSPNWNIYLSEDKKEYALEHENGNYKLVKIPDKIKGKKKTRDVSAILGSVACYEFDLNPKNKYMSLIDNVVFSKDGKILMSYAQFDDRVVYKIPDGTNVINKYAFRDCDNIKQITIPDSVIEIQRHPFSMGSLNEINVPPLVEVLDDTFLYCNNLEKVSIPKNSKLKKIDNGTFRETKISELTLPNFEVEISNLAFGKKEIAEKVKLKSYVKPNVSFECDNNVCNLKWDNIANASYYEVYQKKSDGSYKILKTVKGSSIKINGLKNDKEYTFAVKAVAKIKATPYNQDNYIVGFSDLPEYYTIEGTISDDVTVVGK